MATPVQMPKLGNTVEECLLAKWLKTRGDSVSPGDIIAEIETDKATFEVPAPCDGVMLATFFEQGAVVPVFTNICVIGAAGEDPAPYAPSETPATVSAAGPAETPAVGAAKPVESSAASLAWSPRARRFAREHGMEAGDIRGSGPGGRVIERDVREAYLAGPRLSGVAAVRATEGASVPELGSGVAGMVLSQDLRAPGTRLSGIREKIARRMRESLAQTAQYTMTSSADARRLLALRARVKDAHPDLNINALVLFCAVKALERMPALNAELRDGVLTVHDSIHLAFACDTERGLLVPVIRNAHTMTAVELAGVASALADRATSGAISPDELAGATFTVSNLGALGIESFTPILNPPQVAILGVNAIQLRPMRTEEGIEMIERIGLSLTCDHQGIDGAPGARFLGVLRDCIESVDTLAGLGLGKEEACTTSL